MTFVAVICDADDPCSVNTAYHPESSFTMSPRSTTLPLYFWYWGSNSKNSWDDRDPSVTQNELFATLIPCFRLWSSGSTPSHWHGYETHPGAITFQPKQASSWSHCQRAHPLPATPFQCPRSRTATLEPVYWAASVRPAGDPVDSDPGAVFEDDPHPWSDAGRPLEPWVCRHTQEPTVLSRVNCRPSHLNVDHLHQPCLFTQAHFKDRWGPVLPPLRLTGGFLPRRPDGTTAGR